MIPLQRSVVKREAGKDENKGYENIQSRFHPKYFNTQNVKVKNILHYIISNIKADRVSSILNINDASEVCITVV